MWNQVRFSLKDIKKNKIRIIILGFQIIIFLFFLIVLLDHLLELNKYKENIDYLGDYEIINFNSYYNVSEINLDKEIYDFFYRLLDEGGNAYSILEYVKTNEFFDLDVVIGFGDFAKVFNLDRYKDKLGPKETYVFIGSNVNDLEVGKKIRLGFLKNYEYEIDCRLNKQEAYINNGYKNLDNSILILTTYDELSSGSKAFYFTELISNIHLINPDISKIDQVVKTANKTKHISLTPKVLELREAIEEQYIADYNSIVFFMSFLISSGIFIIVGLVSSLYTTIDNNLNEYSIHRIYGAIQKELYFRIISFLSIIIFLPIAIFFILFNVLDLKYFFDYINITQYIFYVSIFGLILLFFISYLMILKLKNADLTMHLRRNR